jgi:hypothetical protein
MKYVNCSLLVLVLFSQVAFAAEPASDGDVDFSHAVPAQITRGVIESIDLEQRIVIISGYSYDFGPNYTPAEIKMYQSDAGALELLRNGMKVELKYGDIGSTRIPVKVRQLSDQDVVELN